MTAAALTSYNTGIIAEDMVIAYLQKEGYACLARRWKSKFGELDIVMKRGNLICFVEVKARNNLKYNEQVVSRKQQKRNSQAALDFISQYKDYDGDIDIRFDYILVEGDEISGHFENAWYIEEE